MGMATLRQIHQFIATLPDATEQDHHGFPSFRVANKIFATLPDSHHLHIMLAEPEVRMALEIDSVAFQELRWGQKLSGVRVEIQKANLPFLVDLISLAWSRKAPKSLLQHPPDTA
jgi:hypothetical protein